MANLQLCRAKSEGRRGVWAIIPIMTTEQASLILLPGLGADHRLLEPQRRAAPQLVVPNWIPPRRRETLPQYAERLADTVTDARPLVLGGVSLGGMLAYEMARHLRPEAVVLIASCRSCQGVRAMFRWLGPLLSRLPAWCVRCAKPLAPLGSGILGGGGTEFKSLCVKMFKDADCQFMAWALGAILRWHPEPLPGIPVFQIHGGRDRILPVSLVGPDEIIAEGGHLINLTHAERVNDFLSRAMRSIAPVKQTP
jgi:pimeloyl-ACP methyl ester carboxylesterase